MWIPAVVFNIPDFVFVLRDWDSIVMPSGLLNKTELTKSGNVECL